MSDFLIAMRALNRIDDYLEHPESYNPEVTVAQVRERIYKILDEMAEELRKKYVDEGILEASA